MNEIARVPATSSAVERGDVPEVAALGNELSELFNGLGITQRAYALRISVSESLVSRCLSGKRLATQDFIDRLVRETEGHHNTPVRPEVKQHLRELRLAALKATNFAEYQLEALRGELSRANRNVTRLTHREEALHLLIEKKEGELQLLRCEISQTHSDWAAEQVEAKQKETRLAGEVFGLTTERDELMTELEELREDLRNALHFRERAERQSVELKERVLLLEEELSKAVSSDQMNEVTLDVFLAELFEKWTRERFDEVSKELTEAAWTRQLSDVIAVVERLQEMGDTSLLDFFLENVARLRSIDDVITAGVELAALAAEVPEGEIRTQTRWEPVQILCREAAKSRSIGEVARLVKPWSEIRIGTGVLSRGVLSQAFNSKVRRFGVLTLWNKVQALGVSESDILYGLSTLPPKFTLSAVSQLLQDGDVGRAHELLIAQIEYGVRPSALNPLIGLSLEQTKQIAEMVARYFPEHGAARYSIWCVRSDRHHDVAVISRGFASRGQLKPFIDALVDLVPRAMSVNRVELERLCGNLAAWDQEGCPEDWNFDVKG
ncbi:hypothetical protein ACWGGS_14035 [Streptomyces decoyicus]